MIRIVIFLQFICYTINTNKIPEVLTLQNHKRKIFILLLSLTFLLLSTSDIIADSKLPDIGAQSALLIELKTGKTLYEKNSNQKIFPASTTKIMTALLTIEKLDMHKEIIIPTNMGQAEGSAMYLLPGERFTVLQLLQGMMIKSANDAAVILAQEISGDVHSFAELMNEKARQLGCENTNFVNPNGLHDENHYSTAHDMSLIAQEAMKSDLFREIVSTVRLTFDETLQTPEKRYFLNTNRFLWDESKIILDNKYIPIKYEVVNGIKTGYTPEAKNCLVSSGKKDNIELISLVYKANGFEMYRDSRLILDYGFDNFSSKTIIERNKILGRVEVQHTISGFLEYYSKDEYNIVFKKQGSNEATTKIILDDFKLPIKKDTKIGELNITYADESEVIPLYASNDLESIFTIKFLKHWIIDHKIMVSAIVLCVVALISVLIVLFQLSSNRKKRRKKQLKKYNNLY